MNTTPLSRQLQAAREQLAAQRPSSQADATVLGHLTRLQQQQSHALAAQAVPAAGPRRPVQRALRGMAWAAGTLLLLAGALLTLAPPVPEAGPNPMADSGFMPVVSREEWRQALASQREAPLWLMPAELPRERLALLGLPFDPARADQRVQAELMVHPSGQLLAVRFVQ